MIEERKMPFGKYKGQPIKKVIMQHIGYIMWCLNNCRWFSLTDEEQAIYDANAIAIVKYDIQMVFPHEVMLAHVKDREALEKKKTPFIIRRDGMIQCDTTIDSPVINSILPLYKIERVKKSSYNLLPDLSHVARKMLLYDDFMCVDYDDF